MSEKITRKRGAYNNIKPFIFTNRCVRVLKNKENINENNLTESHRSTKLISNQAKEISSGKKPISNFFGDSPMAAIIENSTENSNAPTNNQNR